MEQNWFSFLYYVKKPDTTYVISKSQGPIGIQAVLYCSSCLPLSVSSEKASLLFPQSKHPGAYPTPSYTTWVLPGAWVSPGDSSGAAEKIKLFPTLRRKSLLAPLPCLCSSPFFSSSRDALWPPPCLVWLQEEPSSWGAGAIQSIHWHFVLRLVWAKGSFWWFVPGDSPTACSTRVAAVGVCHAGIAHHQKQHQGKTTRVSLDLIKLLPDAFYRIKVGRL